jgi:Leucine-rich repeat (LRR) protein
MDSKPKEIIAVENANNITLNKIALKEAYRVEEERGYVQDSYGNVIKLNLQGYELSEVLAIKGLKKLTHLCLPWNKLSDTSSLKNLKNLTSINLIENELSDISDLKGLTKLHVLALGGNRISDISALKYLKNLSFLYLEDNCIRSVSALKNLDNLVSLLLQNNGMSDVYSLKELINNLNHLKEIELSGNLLPIPNEILNDLSKLKSYFNEKDKKIKKASVFVTYAWDTDKYNSLVMSFTDFLRKKGFNASMDKKETQMKTATDFRKMMLNGINNNDKVIVILSKKYKKKADKGKNNIYTELNMILDDLEKNNNKYIFVSFGRYMRKHIKPNLLPNVEILDLKQEQDKYNYVNLFAKLMDKNTIKFSDVSPNLPKIESTEIQSFKL